MKALSEAAIPDMTMPEMNSVDLRQHQSPDPTTGWTRDLSRMESHQE